MFCHAATAQEPAPPAQPADDDPWAPPAGNPKQGWLVRALTAMYRADEPDVEDVQWLAHRLVKEPYATGQFVLLHLLLQCPADYVYVQCDGPQIEWLLAALDDGNPLVRGRALELLQRATRSNQGKDSKRWRKWWEKDGDQYYKARNDFIRAAVNAGKYTPPEALSGDEQPDRYALPRPLRDLVLELQQGIDLVVCIDDTQSMIGWMDDAASASLIMHMVLTELTEDCRIGYLSYKDDINKKMNFVTDVEKVSAFLESLSPDGGLDGREGIDEAMMFAATGGFYEWRKQGHKAILLIGDSIAHGTARWINNAKAMHETTGIHVSTFAIKNSLPDGYAEVAAVAGGEAYCCKEQAAAYENFACAATGAHASEEFKAFIHLLIPYLRARQGGGE